MRNNSVRNSYSRYNTYSYSRNKSYGSNRSRYSHMPRYNYTSEAFDWVVEDTAPLKRKNVRKKKVVYSKVKEAAPLSLLKTYTTVAVIFCFVLALLCVYAYNANSRTQIVVLQERLEAAQEDREYIELSIEEGIDLYKIQQEAMKLGLQMPAEYQIVEISVPKDSYTVQYDSGSVEEEKGFFSFLGDLF